MDFRRQENLKQEFEKLSMSVKGYKATDKPNLSRTERVKHYLDSSIASSNFYTLVEQSTPDELLHIYLEELRLISDVLGNDKFTTKQKITNFLEYLRLSTMYDNANWSNYPFYEVIANLSQSPLNAAIMGKGVCASQAWYVFDLLNESNEVAKQEVLYFINSKGIGSKHAVLQVDDNAKAIFINPSGYNGDLKDLEASFDALDDPQIKKENINILELSESELQESRDLVSTFLIERYGIKEVSEQLGLEGLDDLDKQMRIISFLEKYIVPHNDELYYRSLSNENRDILPGQLLELFYKANNIPHQMHCEPETSRAATIYSTIIDNNKIQIKPFDIFVYNKPKEEDLDKGQISKYLHYVIDENREKQYLWSISEEYSQKYAKSIIESKEIVQNIDLPEQKTAQELIASENYRDLIVIRDESFEDSLLSTVATKNKEINQLLEEILDGPLTRLSPTNITDEGFLEFDKDFLKVLEMEVKKHFLVFETEFSNMKNIDLPEDFLSDENISKLTQNALTKILYMSFSSPCLRFSEEELTKEKKTKEQESKDSQKIKLHDDGEFVGTVNEFKRKLPYSRINNINLVNDLSLDLLPVFGFRGGSSALNKDMVKQLSQELTAKYNLYTTHPIYYIHKYPNYENFAKVVGHKPLIESALFSQKLDKMKLNKLNELKEKHPEVDEKELQSLINISLSSEENQIKHTTNLYEGHPTHPELAEELEEFRKIYSFGDKQKRYEEVAETFETNLKLKPGSFLDYIDIIDTLGSLKSKIDKTYSWEASEALYRKPLSTFDYSLFPDEESKEIFDTNVIAKLKKLNSDNRLRLTGFQDLMEPVEKYKLTQDVSDEKIEPNCSKLVQFQKKELEVLHEIKERLGIERRVEEELEDETDMEDEFEDEYYDNQKNNDDNFER